MKTNVPTLVIMLLCAAAAASARGQSGEEPCANSQRSPGLLACAEKEFREAAAELRRVTAELSADLEAQPRAGLRRAERAWVRYRKANCDAEAAIYEGGTIQPLIRTRCMTRVTRERAAELRAQLQTLGG